MIKEQPDNASIGLPLGNQSSQWFVLLYLNKIDYYIKEQFGIKCYVRYMDDMILVHRDKKYLSECKNKIEKICNDLLDLELNEKTFFIIILKKQMRVQNLKLTYSFK